MKPSVEQIETWKARLLARRTITASGCWEWTGARDNHGYGRIHVPGLSRSFKVHRLAAVVWHGTDPTWPGDVMHRCDNPPCFNPEHVLPATRETNLKDAASKGRMARGERQNFAKLTADAVAEIYRRGMAGEMQKTLAFEYGVSRTTVGQIFSGYTWTHVTGLPQLPRRRPRAHP